MSACVITIPADRIEWGPLQHVGDFSCIQQAKLYQGENAVLHLTVQWPEAEPSVPVVTSVQGRHGGERD